MPGTSCRRPHRREDTFRRKPSPPITHHPSPITLDFGLNTQHSGLHYIDKHRYICYDPGVSTKPRPSDCCSPVLGVPDLPDAERARLVALHRALGDATRFEIFRLIAAQPG